MAKKLLLLGLLALTDAASISYPARSNLDFNFNNFGFKVGAKFENKASPRDGGVVYLDIPVSKIMTTLRRPDLLSRLFSTFHEEIALLYHPSFLQRLYNVVNIKLEVAYTSADTLRSGVMTNSVKYIITHHDYSEEAGVIKVEGDGETVVFQVTPAEKVNTKTVFRPLELKLTMKKKQMKMVFTQDNAVYETFFVQRGQVFEATMKLSAGSNTQVTLRVDVAHQKVELTRTEAEQMKTNLVLEANGNLKTGMVRLAGNLEATRWWKEGTPMEFVFKKNGANVDGLFTFNNFKFGKFEMDLTKGHLKLGSAMVMRGIITATFDTKTGVYTMTLPKEWFRDNMNFEIEILTNNFRDFTFNFKRENVVFYTVIFGGVFTQTSIKTVATVESKNTDLVNSFFSVLGVHHEAVCRYLYDGCFTKGKYSMELSKEGILNLHSEKEDALVFELNVQATNTKEKTGLIMNFFHPRLLLKTMNKPLEKLIVKMDLTKDAVTFKTNVEDFQLEARRGEGIAKVTVTQNKEMMALFTVDYKLDTALSTLESQVTLNEKFFLHHALCRYSTHLCFMNLNYYLEVNPGSYKLDHTITRDDTSMLELHLNFKEGPYTLRMNAPYLVPLYKYLTTPTSIFSTFFIPLPMMTAPFEVTLDVDTVERTLRFASNVDHYKTSVAVTPKEGAKYALVYKCGECAEDCDGCEYEFTLARNQIGYGQYKAWRDEQGNHLQYLTEAGVSQTLNLKFDKDSVTIAGDFGDSDMGFHVKQDITVFRPYHNNYAFFMRWAGRVMLPFLPSENINTEGTLAVASEKEAMKMTGAFLGNHFNIAFMKTGLKDTVIDFSQP